MTNAKNIIITMCDCFLDPCIGLNYSLFDYHDFRQKWYDACRKRKDVFICQARDSEHLGKNVVTIVACCLSCVKLLVNLLDVAGIKERIFIECNGEYLRFYYSNSYNEFYCHSDSEDTDFSDNDQENEELITNQFRFILISV